MKPRLYSDRSEALTVELSKWSSFSSILKSIASAKQPVRSAFQFPRLRFTFDFEDVNTYTVFTSPSGTKFKINWFYYDTFEWKTRLAPTEPGHWTFTTTFMRPQDTTVFTGSFTALMAASHGFIRVSSSNPNMFSYTDGRGFFPMGTDGHTPAITAAYIGIPAGPQQVPDMWDSLEAHGVNTYRLYIFNQDAFADSLSRNRR